MNIDTINWVKDGRYRIKVLKLLQEKTYISSELAIKLSVNRASMSRILRDLKSKGLVSEYSNRTRTVTYALSILGKRLIENKELKDVN